MAEVVKPEVLNGFLDDIEHSAGMIRELYRWAEPDAYRRPNRGSTEHTSGGSDGDPVSSTVASTEKYRTKLRHAVRECIDARNRLLGAQADLNDALALLDPQEAGTDTPERSLEHPANRGDLARARAAKTRREVRAASSPFGASEVTG